MKKTENENPFGLLSKKKSEGQYWINPLTGKKEKP